MFTGVTSKPTPSQPPPFRLRPLGDRCWLIDQIRIGDAWQVWRWMRATAPEGIEEVVKAYDTVGVHGQLSRSELKSWLAAFAAESVGLEPGRAHILPACYDQGLDWKLVEETLQLDKTSVVSLHAGRPYLVHALGFQPGFPYLGTLPDEIAHCPRRQEPRAVVPAGSVGIALDQTGIYPRESPGGWNIIARTPFAICIPERDHFPIQPGDTVTFEPITTTEFLRWEGKSWPS